MRVKSGAALSTSAGEHADPGASTVPKPDGKHRGRRSAASKAPAALPASSTKPNSHASSAAVIAAVRARPPSAAKSTTGRNSAASGSKRKQPSKTDDKDSQKTTPNNNKGSTQRNVKPKMALPASPVAPFRQVGTLGVAPMPPLSLAYPDEITALYNQRLKALRKTSKGRKASEDDTSDSRVALRVLPGGQVSARSKNTNKEGTLVKGNKQRPPRPPKRASPAVDIPSTDPPSREVGVSLSKEWHPGMCAAYGITFIDPVVSVSTPPPVPVIHETPSRYWPMPLTSSDLPRFREDDPVKASLEYLRYLARTVGRIVAYPSRIQQNYNAEQKIYRERLARAMLARDGRHTERLRPGGTRRSARTRFAPDVFIPTAAGGPDGRSTVYGRNGRPSRIDGEWEDGQDSDAGGVGVTIQSFDPSEITDVRLGQEFQAELPQLRRIPLETSPEEAQWVGNLILKAGTVPAPRRMEPRDSQWNISCDDERHAAAIARNVANLEGALGSREIAAQFGLGTMGIAMAGELTPEQQEGMYEGMKAFGRDFHKIEKKYVEGVLPRRMAAYYFDVWKLQGVPAARKWYEDKAEEERAREAEAAALEKQRAEEAARRAERQEASNRRRQVKEAVQWIRGSAQGPDAVNFNKPIVRERAGRAIKIIQKIGTEAAERAAALEALAQNL